MKPEKTQSKAVQREQRQPIRTYVKLFPSAGVDSVQENEYEIIDGNTLLQRKGQKKYSMNSFTFIYNHSFDNSKIIEHMNLIDDSFEGKNQTLVFDLHKDILKRFIVGSVEETGVIIELFKRLYEQVHPYKDQKQAINRFDNSSRYQNISVAIFASEENTNKYIDLISGQNFTFYSKRDMDRYKDFYDRIIIQMKQFLIVFKIALIHYAQCCKQDSPIIFRVVLNKFDAITESFIKSTLHIVVCDSQTKVGQSLISKINILVNKNCSRMQDNGSLFNYFERFILQTKILYFYGIPFRKGLVQESKQKFATLQGLRSLSTQTKKSNEKIMDEQIQKINKWEISKYRNGGIKNFNHKEVSLLIKLLQKFSSFLDDSLSKYQSYWEMMESIVQDLNQFYNRQRFPISTEIKEFSIKRFMISKIYKLSETFQLQDLSPKMQKLRRLKNQVALSLKSLRESKQLKQLQNQRYLLANLNQISLIFKFIFQLNYRSICVLNSVPQSQALNQKKFIQRGYRDYIKIGRILDPANIKQLIRILQQQTKSLPYNDKEIMLRQIMIDQCQTLNLQQIAMKNIHVACEAKNEENKTSWLGRKSCEILECQQMVKRKENLEQRKKRMKIELRHNRDLEKKQMMTDNRSRIHERGKEHSVIITNLSQRNEGSERFDKYSLFLPKIAILTRRKQMR